MSAALISTCVGGRRAGMYEPPAAASRATKRHAAARAGFFETDKGVSGHLWGLTRREAEILQAVIDHGHMKVVAAELELSIKTLEHHMGVIRQKSGHRHIAPLVAAYVRAEIEQKLAGGFE